MSKLLSSHEEIVSFLGCTPILYATIRITGLCNLYCKHCYANAGNNVDTSKELNLAQITNTLTILYERGVKRLSISGGEPFCRNDIYDVLETASDLGFDIYLSTNGTNNISVTKLRDLRIKVLQVSIDGLEKTHDRVRGKDGSFSKAISFLKSIHGNCNASVGVAFSLMKCNANEALELYCYLHDNHLADVFSVIPVQKLGRAEHSDMLAASELQSVLVELADYYFNSDHAVELNIMAPPAIVPKAMRGSKYENGYVCEFPYSIAIDPDGNYAICDGLLNLKEFILNDVINDINFCDNLFQSKISKNWLNTSPATLEGICSICRYAKICCGGCRVDAFLKTGSFFSSDPLCQRYYDVGIFPKEYIVTDEIARKE